MAKMNEYFPEEVLHPGVTLSEILEELEMSRKEFALRTSKPEKTIIAILRGSSSITPEMAVLFENTTKIPAHFWINKQSRYNEFKARKQRKQAVEKAEEWTRTFPYTVMANYEWVPKTRKIEEKTINLFEFFAISTHEAWEKLYIESQLKVAAYASLKHTHEPQAISAWLRQGEIEAEKCTVPELNKKTLKQNLYEIKSIMAAHPKDFFQLVRNLCMEAGVKVFYTPILPKVPISGSTRWIKDTPVIQLSARYKQNDRFWFTFFHEVGHILLHGKKYISLEGINFSDADPVKEQEAHDFAEGWTFSKSEEKELLSEKQIDENLIIKYANRFNTHPALIIGRLQHKGLIPFSIGRGFIESIDLSSQ
jgi:HTH-type transcriptional regulator/antitoxin HigA